MEKLIIFDVDGTLLNTIETIAYNANKALEDFSYDPVEIGIYRKHLGNGSYMLIKGILQEKNINLEQEKINEIVDKYHLYYNYEVAYLTNPYNGVLDLCKKLRQDNIVGLISNKPDQTLQILLDDLGIKEEFDFAYGQRSGIEKKPDPQVVFDLMEEFNIEKENTMIIGDSEIDIQTGKNAGILNIAVSWGFRDKEELMKMNPDHIFDTIEEVTTYLEN